jgi:hypothetical protein
MSGPFPVLTEAPKIYNHQFVDTNDNIILIIAEDIQVSFDSIKKLLA